MAESGVERVAAAYRLNAQQQQDLRDVVRGVEESQSGLNTRYLREGPENATPGPDGFGGVHLYDVERFCEMNSVWTRSADPERAKWRDRVRRVRRAVDRMLRAGEHAEVGALHVVYGDACPSVRGWPEKVAAFLGDLAPLVRFTDATEERRRLMIRRGLAWSPGQDPNRVLELAVVVDFARAREREQWLDRVISSGDAVADALAPFRAPAPARGERTELEHKRDLAAHEEARAAHAARRAAFLVAARADADAMLSYASFRYNEAWKSAR